MEQHDRITTNVYRSNNKSRADYKFKWSITAVFAFSTCLLKKKNIIISGSSYLYDNNGKLNLIVIAITIVLYVWSLFLVERKIRVNPYQILLLFSIFLFWGISFMLNGNIFRYSFVKEEFVFFITYSLPALVFLPMLGDCEELLRCFQKYKWITFFSTVITVFLMVKNGRITTSGTRYEMYSMSFGRAALLPCLLFFEEWSDNKNILSLACGMINALFIFLFGSRFPLLCIAFFVIWKFFQTGLSTLKVFLTILSGLLLILLLMNLEAILEFVNTLLLGFGIRSRALALLSSAQFGYDDGRIIIFTQLIMGINQSPIYGYGAGGGNIILNNGLSHNFYLDLFANLGYLFGGIILIASLVAIARLYRRNRHSINIGFITICLSIFIPTSFIQTSFWRANYYWYLIALVLGHIEASERIIKK